MKQVDTYHTETVMTSAGAADVPVKVFYRSRRFWGLLAAVLGPVLLALLGVDVDLSYLEDGFQTGDIPALLLTLSAIAGAIIAAVGGLRAPSMVRFFGAKAGARL